MTVSPRARMTADAFIAWAMEQPEGERYELVQGEIVAMAPERSAHALTKARIWRALDDAIAAAGLHCTAYPDGMSVEVDEDTVYEPDVLVRCGEPLPDEAVKLQDPLIVVEVLSPSTRARDAGAKLEDYFRLPSLRHYLIVKTENRSVIHHRRGEAGRIETHILRGSGRLELEPPGLVLTVESFFRR
ncbi:Uma2 family endonuclease [Benzoatithermus flavus]|uniref:Uma2 family endonuclease n=1 Tax=Benzoatithermus flavus TaxID=3108223 RepID=A0ABU8XVV5_9PROT